MHEEKAAEKVLRRMKAIIKNVCYDMLVTIKRAGKRVLGK